MKIARYLFLLSLLSQLLLLSCDDASSIKDPNESFFIKFYGGDGDQTGKDVAVLPDGTFLLFGTTRPSGQNKNSQWYLVKADTKGNVIWEKTFGGLLDEEASDIELTSDNKIVLAGTSQKSSTDRDIFLMTLSLDGIKIDSAVYPVLDSTGAVTAKDEDVRSITQTLDGGFIVAGSTTYVSKKGTSTGFSDPTDALNLRFNSDLSRYANGWPKSQTNGYFSSDISQKIFQVTPNLFYVFAYTNTTIFNGPVENYNFWVYGLNGTSGLPVGGQLAVGVANSNEILGSVALVPSQSGGGFFLGGLANSQDAIPTSDIQIARLRASLAFNNTDVIVQKPLSIKLGSNLSQQIVSVSASQSGGFLILSNEQSVADNQNWLLTKVNNDGSFAWNFPIVFGGDGLDMMGSVTELADGKIAVVGTMRTGKPDVGEFKMTLIKVNSEGKLER